LDAFVRLTIFENYLPSTLDENPSLQLIGIDELIPCQLDRKHIDPMVINTTWTLWKQRNVIAFDNVWEQKNPGQMPKEIREEFHIWERTKRGGRLGPVQE
jgi:hypothetical protein